MSALVFTGSVDKHIILEDLMYSVTQILDQMDDVTWFLVGGSALGAIRDGGCVPGDDDSDVGIIGGDDVLERIFRELRKKLPKQFRIEVCVGPRKRLEEGESNMDIDKLTLIFRINLRYF